MIFFGHILRWVGLTIGIFLVAREMSDFGRDAMSVGFLIGYAAVAINLLVDRLEEHRRSAKARGSDGLGSQR